MAGAAGTDAGAGFALSLPLGAGLRDALFVEAFAALGRGCVAAHRPSAVVLQLGCDGLAGDPVARGAWSLSPAAFATVAAEAAAWGLPLLVLGGGGYRPAAAACAWAAATAALLGRALPDDVPAECEGLELFGPGYSISKGPGRLPLAGEGNDAGAVRGAVDALVEGLRAAAARRPWGAPGIKRAKVAVG